MTTIAAQIARRMMAQVIDGSYLEGGGQILRNTFAYSALLRKPITVEKVRGNRTPPGLRPQHAEGLKLMSEISVGSTLDGAAKGSSDVQFTPGNISAGDYLADPKTAGSTTLLLQVSLPCLLFPSPESETRTSTLTLRGGTNAIKAPPIDFVINVLFPFLSKHFDLHPTLDLRRRGYYPKGQGEIYVTIPAATKPIPALNLLTRGKVTRIRGRSYVAGNLPAHLPGTIARTAKKELKAAGYEARLFDIDEVQESPEQAVGSASGLFLWAETEGGCILSGSSIGERGKRAEVVGKEAAEELVANLAHGGCVDEYLQDQIIIFMALAEGKCTVVTGPISLHTKTAIWIAETLTDARFNVKEEGGENGRVTIECQGIGLRATPPR